MLSSTLKFGVVGGSLLLLAPGLATAQNWGDVARDALGGDNGTVACGLMGNCQQTTQRGSQNGVSDVEKAMMLAEWTNRLQSAQRPVSPTADQAQLYNYADNYAVQGGLWGTIVGAVVGCIIADFVMDSSCSKGAIIGAPGGAVAGAVIGSRVGQRQNVYRDREASLNTKLATAQADLDDARTARASAERVAYSHRQNLARLQSEAKYNTAKRQEFEREIQYATKDLEAMMAANSGLEKQIQLLQAEIYDSRPTPEEQAQSQRIIAELQAESQRMSAALQTLSGAVQSARV